MPGLSAWSEAHLGQWHYALGYALTLASHNWPLMLALVGAAWFGYRAYTRPDRRSVSWLLTALLLGLAYEYDKHIARELHQAVDFLFLGELAGLNQPVHLMVGTALRATLALACLAMLAQSLRLSAAALRASPPATALVRAQQAAPEAAQGADLPNSEQQANPGAWGAEVRRCR